MILKKFEQIEAWKEARILVKEIYGYFLKVKDFGFKDQIQRAAISAMSNIAEGFDRGSNKEFIQYLIVSRSSVSEVRSLSYAAFDLEYIDENIFEKILERSQKLSKLINGFIRYLKDSKRKS